MTAIKLLSFLMHLLQNRQCQSSFIIRLEIGTVFNLVCSNFFQYFIYNCTVNNLNVPLFGFSALNLLTIKSNFQQNAFNKMYIYNTLSLFRKRYLQQRSAKFYINIALLGVGELSLVKLMSTMNCARQINKPMNEKLDALGLSSWFSTASF